MKIYHSLVLGIFCSILLTGTAFAQQIQTNTSVTTQGSTTFGYLPNATDLGVFMQTTVAPTCTTVSTNVQTCTSDGGTAVGDNDNFVRVDQMPGSFTDSPTGAISALPNFACGQTVSANLCTVNLSVRFGPADGQAQTAPNFTGRQLVGNINTNITVGDGGATAGMPDGFIAFTLDPATGAATIDQFIEHTIDLGGGSLMVFQQRSATIGVGNTIPDGAVPGLMDGGPLPLLPFTALDIPSLGTGIADTPLPALGMVDRMVLNQGDADGFGGLTRDVTTNFPGVGIGAGDPVSGDFFTPGLNTGINPNGVPPGGPFDGFAFP